MAVSNAPYALVVDDDPLIRLDAAIILEDAGFRTFEATSGDHAIDILQDDSDLIVVLFSDVEMPGSRDGFALARETARHWPHIAIVVASGRQTPQDGEMPDGSAFIPKPFSADVVREHLKVLVPEDRKPEPLKD